MPLTSKARPSTANSPTAQAGSPVEALAISLARSELLMLLLFVAPPSDELRLLGDGVVSGVALGSHFVVGGVVEVVLRAANPLEMNQSITER